jgi:hypothetical protein
MLKHLQELIEAIGEVDVQSISARGADYSDVSLNYADETGVVILDNDGARVFIPWSSVGTLKLCLSE